MKKITAEAATIPALCWFLLLSQTDRPWDGRGSPSVLQNLSSFLYLPAGKVMNWVIKSQMPHSHCTALGNPHTEHWTRRAGSPGPLLQQPRWTEWGKTKIEWGKGNCAALWIFLPLGKLPGWIRDAENQTVKRHWNPQLPSSSGRRKLWIAFTNLIPSCLHSQDHATFPPGYRAIPEPDSWVLSFHAHSLLPFPFIDTGKKNANISLITVIITATIKLSVHIHCN